MRVTLSGWTKTLAALGLEVKPKPAKPRRAAVAGLKYESLEPRQLLAVSTWDGGGANNLWSTGANWASNVAPVAGDQLVFDGTTRTSTQNNLAAGTSFQSIKFKNDNFSISGNNLAVTSSITVDSGVSGSSIGVGVALGGNTTVNVVSNGLTVSGVVSGSNNLTKSGAGTLTLTASNTWSGTTTISAGTLQVGSGGTTGTLGTGSITDNATLKFNRSNSLTVSNSIGGNGDVTQAGTGTTTLSGSTVNYTGTTAVNNGTLKLSNVADTYKSSTSIASGATLEMYVTGTLTTSAPWTISGTGTLEKTGTGTWVLAGSSSNFVTMGMTGGLVDVQDGTLKHNFSTANWASNKADLKVTSGATLDMYASNVKVNALTGSGTIQNSYAAGGTKTLTVGIDDGGGSFGGVIAGTGGGIALTKSGSGTQSLTGNNTYTGTTNINDGTLKLSGNVDTQKSDVSIDSGAALEVLISSGTLTNANPWTISGTGTLVKSGSGTWVLASSVTDVVTIAMTGGLVDLAAGTIKNNWTTANWASNKADLAVASGAALDLYGSNVKVDALTGAGTVKNSYAAGGTKTLSIGNDDGSGTFSGVISGTAGGDVTLSKNGTGTQTLTGNNTYTGNTNINDGTLKLSDNVDTQKSDVTIDSGTFLEVLVSSGTATTAHPWTISGSGTLKKTGTGAWLLSGSASDYVTIAMTGGIVNLSAGTIKHSYGTANWFSNQADLQISSDATLDLTNSNVKVDALTGAGTITNSYAPGGVQTLTVGVDDGSGTFSGEIGSAYVAITKSGSGTETLTGNNTYGGTTTVNAGTLKVGNAGTTGTLGTGNVTDNATLTFNRTDDFTQSNNFSGSGELKQNGTGTVTLSGNNSGLTGQVTVTAGTLRLGSANSGSASAAWQVNSGATLEASASVNLGSLSGDTGSVVTAPQGSSAHVVYTVGALNTTTTFSGDIRDPAGGTGTVALHKVGTGDLILGGKNTYTGPTTHGSGNSRTPDPANSGNVNEESKLYEVTIGGLTEGTTAVPEGTSDLEVCTRVVWARNWQDAVQQVVSGTYTTGNDPGGFGPPITYTFEKSNITFGSNPGGQGYAATDKGASFLITDQLYVGGDLQDVDEFEGFIALEDLYHNTYIGQGSDNDYDDWYWKVTVKPWEVSQCYDCLQDALAQGGTNASGVTVDGQSHTSVEDTAGSSTSNQGTSPDMGSNVNSNSQVFLVAEDVQDNWDDPARIAVLVAHSGVHFKREGVDSEDSNLVNYVPDTGHQAGGEGDRLVHDLSADTYTYSLSDGRIFKFNGLSDADSGGTWECEEAGRQDKELDAYGHEIDNDYNSEDQLTDTTTPMDDTGDALQQEHTDYYTTGANKGLRSTVTEKISSNGGSSWTNNRVTSYTYYTDSDSHGNQGNLKSVIVKDGSGNTLNTQYFRYYKQDTSSGGTQIGYKSGQKLVFGNDSYARLTAAGLNINTATDAQLKPYADQYLEYDAQHRVTKQVIQGEGCTACSAGLGTYTYTYATSSVANPNRTTDPYAYNVWTNKLVETRDDGSTHTIYTNKYSQTILEITNDPATSAKQMDYYLLGTSGAEAGKVLKHANTSAIASYSESAAGLVTLYTNQGLIDVMSYYATTTATESTAGGVAGYVKDQSIQRGSSSTPILQGTTDYFKRSGGGATIFPIARYTVYRTEGATSPASSGAETTSYAYTYFTGTTQIESTTFTLPVISAEQNGPGVADVIVTFNDTFGRTIWTKDADGFLTYTQYDPATGAVVKTIEDVDTEEVGDFTGLPDGWETPEDVGGLHLITTYEVDTLGRTTKTTDANGHITFTVYNDPNHEVRMYAGFTWDEEANGGLGGYVRMDDPPPTTVSRLDLPGSYYETVTMAATPDVDASGRPLGTETFTISDIQTLSRSYMNSAGQMVTSDEYFDFTGMSYSTATNIGVQNTNFYRTEYRYGHQGRLERTVDPTGTITRTVYDGLGREVSTWVGTDDTPTTGFWSPTNNAGANMVQLSEYEYDNGGVGDSNLTQSTQFPDDTGYNDRVTQYFYDWRDRTVATKSGVLLDGSGDPNPAGETDGLHRPISYTVYDNLGEATQSLLFDGDGVTIADGNSDGVPDQPDAELLRAKSTTDYDDQGRVFHTTQFEVDQTTGEIGEETIETNSFYDHRGMVSQSVDPLEHATTYEYDGVGRLTTTTLPDPDGPEDPETSPVYHTTYDGVGNTLAETDALNNVTTYEYDAADRLVRVIQADPDGDGDLESPVTLYAYDDSGWQESVTDPLLRVTSYEYDRLSRTVTTTSPDPDDDGPLDAPVYHTTYDGVGHVLTKTDALENVTTYQYDPIFQYLTQVTMPDPDGDGDLESPIIAYTFDNLGETLTMVDPLLRTTTYEYNALGQNTKTTQPDPDGEGEQLAPWTVLTFDVFGAMLTSTDRLNHTSANAYDGFHRLAASIDANEDATLYHYDLAGNLQSLIDPADNTTEYDYDNLDRLKTETITVDSEELSRGYEYDAMGNLRFMTDRNDRVTEYVYDNLYRRTAEKWLDGESVVHEFDYAYDAAGQMESAADSAAEYNYLYDGLGRVQTETQDIAGLTPQIVLTTGYDPMGNRLKLSATIGGNDDFVNDYLYDNLYRMTRVTQQGAIGGNAVAEKRVDMAYDVASQRDTITRFADVGGTQLVAQSTYGFDGTGRLTSLSHDKGLTNLAAYTWQYDAANWVSQFISSNDGTSDYGYDDRGQVTSASHDYQTDETYNYDENGNRTTGIDSDNYSDATFVTGDQNRLSSDGTYDYDYDGEGNRIRRTRISDDEVTVYTWDYRNRLTGVTTYASTEDADNQEDPTKIVNYTYNAFDQRLTKEIDTDGDGMPEVTNAFVYDGVHIALQFDGTEEPLSAADLAHRYVFGNEVDQVLAVERVSSLASPGDILWPLADNQGTVRDLANYDSDLDETSVANHIVYDSFGNVVDESAPSVDFQFGYTGRERDEETGLNYYRARYVDPVTGQFISADPADADVNTYRYVANGPLMGTDPSGLDWLDDANSELLQLKRQGRITEEDVELRLKILGRVRTARIVVPGEGIPERRPAGWRYSRAKGAYVIQGGTPNVIRAMNELIEQRHKEPPAIYCKKLSELLIMEGFIKYYQDHSNKDALDKIAATIGENIPSHVFRGRFVEKAEVFPNGAALSDLIPGDQVWFKNPCYTRENRAAVRKLDKTYQGEEGSNVFYVGKGYVMRVYSIDGVQPPQVFSIRRYQQRIARVFNTAIVAGNPDPATFLIKRVLRPKPVSSWIDPNN